MTRAALPGDWVDQAVCATVDPELFFPDDGDTSVQALRVCRGCEVKSQCLAYAMDNDIRFGIWGGTGSHFRAELKRQKRRRQG